MCAYCHPIDQLQPMDLSVNKPAKVFLKEKLEMWYADQVVEQLKGKDTEKTELQPIALNLTILKELMARWLVEMAEYLAENPLLVVKGFIKAGITGAIDGCFDQQDEESNAEHKVELDEEEEDSGVLYDTELEEIESNENNQ